MRRNGHEWMVTVGVIALGALGAALVARGGGRARAPAERWGGEAPRRLPAPAAGSVGARAAYAPGVAAGAGERDADGAVRPAGPEAMRDPDRRWDPVDEALDETFPASDPPATY